MSEATLRLHEGETAVIGYGSLLSVASVSRTLRRAYEGPFLTCSLDGWRRSWDVSMPNEAFYHLEGDERVYPGKILYLNARAVPGVSMNCTLFVVRSDELRLMNAREWIYDTPVVTGSVRGVRIENGDAILYVGRPEHLVRDAAMPRDAAVRASYLRVLSDILGTLEPGFVSEYWRTTDPVPQHLVIDDLLDPERPTPWARAGHDYDPRPHMPSRPLLST